MYNKVQINHKINFVISMELVLYIIMCHSGRNVKRDVSPFSSQVVLVCAEEVFRAK